MAVAREAVMRSSRDFEQVRRQVQREDRLIGWLIAVGLIVFVVGWAVIIYVLLHFILKFW